VIAAACRRPVAAVALAALAAACAPNLPASFSCTSANQCVFHGTQGTCEPGGACSFPDTSCAGGRRYGDFAPPGLADQCVGTLPSDGGSTTTPMPDLGATPAQITRLGTTTTPLGAHGTTLTINTPGSLVTGDFLFVSIFADDAGAAVTPPGGWTIHADLMVSVGANFRATWLYTRVGASAPSHYDFTLAVAANNSAGALVAYRGVDGTAPIDAATNQLFEATNFDAPAITTRHANDMLVAAFVNAMSQGLSWTAPSGMQSAVASGPTGIFDGVQAMPGTTGDKQASFNFPVPGFGAVDFLALTP
jgi:hypothetical protein